MNQKNESRRIYKESIGPIIKIYEKFQIQLEALAKEEEAKNDRKINNYFQYLLRLVNFSLTQLTELSKEPDIKNLELFSLHHSSILMKIFMGPEVLITLIANDSLVVSRKFFAALSNPEGIFANQNDPYKQFEMAVNKQIDKNKMN